MDEAQLLLLRDAPCLGRVAWAASVQSASRRILRAGRSLACWVALDCVVFPLCLLLRVCHLSVPLHAVFCPTWLALGTSVYTSWTCFRARQAVRHSMGMPGRRLCKPPLEVGRMDVSESQVLNVLHFAISLPLPLIHLASSCDHFVEGCLLSLVPSEILSVIVVWIVLRHRCPCCAIFGMITSALVVIWWSFFPGCVVPLQSATPQIHPLVAVFWLLPVTIPYFLLFSFFFDAGASSLAATVPMTFFAVVCLHLTLFGARVHFSALCCMSLAGAGSIWVVRLLQLADRRASMSGAQIDAVFAHFANVLE